MEAVDEQGDVATGGQAGPERRGGRDAVAQELRHAGLEYVPRMLRDVALDTAAGDGAAQLAALRDRELRADRARRRTAGGDDPCDREAPPPPPPPPAVVGGPPQPACPPPPPRGPLPPASRLARARPGGKPPRSGGTAAIP